MKTTRLFLKTISLIGLISVSSFAKIDGGISGGGGYVINPIRPSYPQSTEVIEDMIKESKKLVVLYVQQKKNQFHADQMGGHEKRLYDQLLNSSQKNIDQVLAYYSVHVEDENPCYTSDKVPVDGSIFSEKPNSICISAHTFAEKVHAATVHVQAAALILHEMSEVVGLSDEDAIRLQKIALNEIK